jgi:hypothetical protein
LEIYKKKYVRAMEVFVFARSVQNVKKTTQANPPLHRLNLKRLVYMMPSREYIRFHLRDDDNGVRLC